MNLNKKEKQLILFLLDYVEECTGKLLDTQKKLRKKFKRSLKPIKISSGKKKGKGLQQWVCGRLSTMLGIEYDQSNDACLIHSREMGLSGTDVILRGEAADKFPFSIECKNVEKLNLYKAIEQSKCNIESGKDWLVIHKKNGSKPIVIMDWEAFEKWFYKVLD